MEHVTLLDESGAAIYGAAMTLNRDDVVLNETQREGMLNVVAGESERLARIVNDILLASRLDSGVASVSIGRADAAEIARGVLAAARGRRAAAAAPDHVPADRARAPGRLLAEPQQPGPAAGDLRPADGAAVPRQHHSGPHDQPGKIAGGGVAHVPREPIHSLASGDARGGRTSKSRLLVITIPWGIRFLLFLGCAHESSDRLPLRIQEFNRDLFGRTLEKIIHDDAT